MKKILFSLIALIIFCSTVAQAETKNPAVGDIVTFGKFNGDSLSWLVLDVDEKNNRALLITENCVAKQAFAQSNYEWSTSYVRAYLNGTGSDQFFSDSNFSESEKAKVLKVLINSTTTSKKSNAIIKSYGTDYVFLLGVTDANQYFGSDTARVAKFNNSACKWWLRYSTQSYAKAGYVSSKGKVYSDGSLVSYNTVGVRPAMWVTLPLADTDDSSDDNTSADSVTADGNSILAMSDDEIKAKYEKQTNVAITGTLDSAEKLSQILEKISKVTSIENLDLRSLNINEINFDNAMILNINFEGNTYIKKINNQGGSIVTLNLSGSSVEEISANSCEFLEEVNLTNCKNASQVKFNQTYLGKLVLKGCENLTDLSCESSDLSVLDIEGCAKLKKLNLKNNALPKLNVSNESFPELEEFTCGNQYLLRGLLQNFNFNNFLQDSLITSATVADLSELDNVKNLKVYDESGNELVATLDKVTGIITITGDAALNEETGLITINAGEPYKLTYDYDTGFKQNGANILMDVTVESGGERKGGVDFLDDSLEDNSSSSSSGCNSGFGLVILGLLLNFSRKKFTKK